MEIQSLGMTTEHDGEVVLVMSDDTMPPGCYVVFILKEDYPKLLALMKD